MLESFKRWLSSEPQNSPWADVVRWAKKEGFEFRRAKEDAGFVVEGAFGDRPWRLEYGPPQRSYIATRELRLRMELNLSPSIQMLVMGRQLMERLERETFERYTEGTQTQIDVETPEEMRWLAMFPKLPLVAVTRAVRARLAAVANQPEPAAAWIDSAVAATLVEAAGSGFLKDDPAFVMMTLRGRIYLRLELPEPDIAAMAQTLTVLDAASQSARRVAAALAKADSNEWPSSATTAWQTQLGAEDAPPDKR